MGTEPRCVCAQLGQNRTLLRLSSLQLSDRCRRPALGGYSFHRAIVDSIRHRRTFLAQRRQMDPQLCERNQSLMPAGELVVSDG